MSNRNLGEFEQIVLLAILVMLEAGSAFMRAQAATTAPAEQ